MINDNDNCLPFDFRYVYVTTEQASENMSLLNHSKLFAFFAIITAPLVANAPDGLYQLLQQLNGIFFIPSFEGREHKLLDLFVKGSFCNYCHPSSQRVWEVGYRKQ